MNIHRLIALVSTTVLGLLGAAQASNFARPEAKGTKVVIERGLREKVQNANIQGCR